MKIKTQIEGIQKYLVKQSMDGWLLYSFDHQNPIAEEITGFDASRRWFLLIKQNGTVTLLVQSIEEGYFSSFGLPYQTYASGADLSEKISSLLGGCKTVAMEYSPLCEIPYVSKIDAGTFELITKTGVQVVSSMDLVQQLCSLWEGPQGTTSHANALGVLHQAVTSAWALVKDALENNKEITEYEVQQHIVDVFTKNNLITNHPPIVAVGSNSADAHYAPSKTTSRIIGKEQVLMIDLWARENTADSIYADITWMGYTGKTVPEEIQQTWGILKGSRDAALEFLRNNKHIQGWQVDDACRNKIKAANLGEYFTHRTGHSIHTELHARGVNIDNFELHDTRAIVADCGFSIEPGIYIPGKYGMRTEIDVYMNNDLEPQVFGPIQEELLTL